MKRFLVLGSGAREHAICWRLSHEAEVHCSPGNPGIADEVPCYGIALTQVDELVALAKRLAPVTIVVGPEDPLILGIADRFREEGFPVFGPGAFGAQLEGSKAFSKELMRAHSIPTAAYTTCSDSESALAAATEKLDQRGRVVLKASGNALGKGVIIACDIPEAKEALSRFFVQKEFGDAGSTVVVEDYLDGFEFSLLTLVNGYEILSLPVAQDYKRAFDGDSGPNTGGMGSYSPAESVDGDLLQQSEQKIVWPIVKALQKSKNEFRGLLFSGIMVNNNDPYCLEYNVRFGDPETQSVMMRIISGLGDALHACAEGRPIPPIQIDDRPSVTVVVAAPGYPTLPIKGAKVQLAEAEKDTHLFHAGTKLTDGALSVSGGRVFSASAIGPTIKIAREMAYSLAKGVQFEGAWMRSDIAQF